MHSLPLLGIIFALTAVPAATGESSTAPKAPTDLTLTSATDAGLSVTWKASRPRGGRALAGYRVYLDGNRPNASAAVDTTAEITKVEFTSLRCGTSYTVGVDGVDDAGSASEVAAITASTSPCTTDTTAPTSPSGLAQTASGDASVTVSWTAAGDATGVAGYSLALNGSDAGTTTQTTHTFASLACGSSYTVEVVAYDAAGNRSSPSSVTTTTATCPTAGTTTAHAATETATTTVAAATSDRFTAEADARASEASPSSNYGRSSYLRVDAGSDPDVQSYVRFGVSGLHGDVTEAKLRVYVTSGTSNGPAVYATASGWSETGITWATRPATVGAPTDNAGAASSGTWLELDVTTLVTGDGSYSFALVGDSSDGMNTSSRDGANPPELVVTSGGAVGDREPPTAPTTLVAADVTPSSVTLTWLPSTDNVGVAGYRVVYLDGTRVATTPDRGYTVTGLRCDTSFLIAVEAYDAAGNTSPRASVRAKTAICDVVVTACDKVSSPSGSDSNAGTEASPFRTVKKLTDSLRAGQTGCLRGGTYGSGTLLTWSTDATASARITLMSFPGERATISGTEVLLSGDYLTLRDVTVRDVVHTDGDGVSASGTGARFEGNVIQHVARNGILLHSSARNVVVARNLVEDVGWNSSMLPSRAHGLYVQGSGHRVWRNVFTRTYGYGMQLYQSPGDIVIAENTAVDSVLEKGISLRCWTGGTITIVNNIFEGGRLYDCPTASIDTNVVYPSGWSYSSSTGPKPTNTIVADPGLTGDYRLAAGSPAIDGARADFAMFPDRAMETGAMGAGPDLGAYESG